MRNRMESGRRMNAFSGRRPKPFDAKSVTQRNLSSVPLIKAKETRSKFHMQATTNYSQSGKTETQHTRYRPSSFHPNAKSGDGLYLPPNLIANITSSMANFETQAAKNSTIQMLEVSQERNTTSPGF